MQPRYEKFCRTSRLFWKKQSVLFKINMSCWYSGDSIPWLLLIIIIFSITSWKISSGTTMLPMFLQFYDPTHKGKHVPPSHTWCQADWHKSHRRGMQGQDCFILFTFNPTGKQILVSSLVPPSWAVQYACFLHWKNFCIWQLHLHQFSQAGMCQMHCTITPIIPGEQHSPWGWFEL